MEVRADDRQEECIEFESPVTQPRDVCGHEVEEKKTPDVPSADESYHMNELGEEDSAVVLLSEIFPDSTASELREFHKSRCRIASPPQVTRKYADLPKDFLRLPTEVAIRRQGRNGRVRYEILHQMEQRVIVQHAERRETKVNGAFFTKVLPRTEMGGLGMTVVEDCGLVRVHNLEKSGPALRHGIQCGDILVGIDGIAFVESIVPGVRIINEVVARLRAAPEPVVLHLQRPRRPPTVRHAYTSQSLLNNGDGFLVSRDNHLLESELTDTRPLHLKGQNAKETHPFARLLRDKNLVHNTEEMVIESRMLYSYQDTVLAPGKTETKAFSVHIVNYFKENDRVAYTIWVYDVDSGREWYAPMRYYCDFVDLRSAVNALGATIRKIPFPKERRSIFLSPAKERFDDEECRGQKLESYIRSLCHLSLDPNLPEASTLSVYIQSFLGCSETLPDLSTNSPPRMIEVRHNNNNKEEEDEDLQHHQSELRIQMGRAIQRYTYRVLMLNSIRRTLQSFVQGVKAWAPTREDMEDFEAKGSVCLKKRAMEDMKSIQSFLDNLQDLILQGCSVAFESISQSPLFAAIQDGFRLSKPGNDDSLDRLIRNAVREQVEVDVYVPLRSVVSRWLVQGWRHDDMETHFKVEELRKKPTSFFRIPHFDWSFAIEMLERVGVTTLPCAKLKSIATAAREIVRVLEANSVSKSFGADDFLPVFIFCVVHAKIERPCALLVLLRTMCDEINKIGEVGYYLLTFEAAISHCQDIDLTVESEHLDSFLSVPLDES